MKDILPLVEKPSRYLGSEVNSVHKDPAAVRLKMALAFPDLYDIGMSHFGIQILYHVLNSEPEIAVERVFAPGLDMAERMRAGNMPLSSLESGTPLSGFDIIGFSLLYELNYSNLLLMLDLAGIPFRAEARDLSHPLVIAGGPCTVNPEPMADFFDAMLVGDGETAALEMARTWLKWKAGGPKDKEALLKAWSGIEGVYIPSFFKAEHDPSGFQRVLPDHPEYTRVIRRILPDLEDAAFPDAPVVPYGRPVHDRLRLEVARGCTRGCRFCQAGMIYRPVRERSLNRLLDLADRSLAATGYDDISLLSLSTGDYGCLDALMRHLMRRYAGKNISVSLPSFRAGTLGPQLMEMIRQIRKTGFTIAPEAGSRRLRSVINKNIGEKEIFDTVKNAFDMGWRVIKLYFMIGLPTETDADIAAIVDMVKRIRRIKTKTGRPSLNVSVATFIPKSHTPFQWAPQISLAESKEKIFYLRRQLKIPGVRFKWQKPEASLLEGLFARGDRRLSGLLETAYDKGCRFDGWTDSLDFERWTAAMDAAGIDPGFYTTRKRDVNEPLPWDHIDTRVAKAYLISEFKKASEQARTPDCRGNDCLVCGVCDFKTISPKIEPGKTSPEAPPTFKTLDRAESVDIRVEVTYSKTGQARYFGHLEMVNIFFRAIRRAGLPIRFTRGFHPKPKISFNDPLPVGMESTKESFLMTVREKIDTERLVADLNAGLPEGLWVIGCRIVATGFRPEPPDTIRYTMTLADAEFDPQRLKAFIQAPQWIFHQRKHKGGIKKIDLKSLVSDIGVKEKNRLQMKIRQKTGMRIRPGDVAREIFQLPEGLSLQARVVKTPEQTGRP